jgi:hypothetical protein
MAWQELVFTLGSMVGILALLPTLRDRGAAVPRRTSVLSVLVGGAYAAAFLSLGMWLSAAGAALTASVWFGIAALRGEAGPNGSM